MSDWHSLSGQSDIDQFQKLFGDFHDGCIREMHLWTETFVNENLSMSCPSHLDTHVRILFQRQSAAPSAIELQFDEVVQFRMRPSSENYDSIIFDAAIFKNKEVFYWTDGGAGSLNESSVEARGALVAGKKLKWRDASSFMGAALRYCDKTSLENSETD